MGVTSVSRVRVHVAFTPSEAVSAPIGVVVDVLRATSTIAQALAAGWPRVLCAPGVDEARAVREQLGEGLLGGERNAERIEGFDVGASPREFLEGGEVPLIFSTTNGTRAILTAAASCDRVVLGSLLNLDAVAASAREGGDDVVIVCAGFQGTFAFDDAYCAGRVVQLLDGERTDAAKAAELIARAFPDPYEGLTARTYGPPGLEEDIRFCAQENVLDTVPRFTRMIGPAAEIVPS
jgi:2-phosphosulfolactate phosphatase